MKRFITGGSVFLRTGGRGGHEDIPRRGGFTLIELLVVVAIIGVLAALGFSGASAAIKKSQMTECLSNMRQIGTAMQLFVGENGGRLPGTSHLGSNSPGRWTTALAFYLGTNFSGKCPAMKKHPDNVTYGWNDMLMPSNSTGVGLGLPMAAVKTPSSTLLVAEKAYSNVGTDHLHFSRVLGVGGRGGGRISLNQFKREVEIQSHGNSANYLFVDGHVENLTTNEVQKRLSGTRPIFLVND
jgi:prepilin-type N-terminal cleavage/methylation domain-containing protein/prepilin-type processing-associated H-X9-DG protein